MRNDDILKIYNGNYIVSKINGDFLFLSAYQSTKAIKSSKLIEYNLIILVILSSKFVLGFMVPLYLFPEIY